MANSVYTSSIQIGRATGNTYGKVVRTGESKHTDIGISLPGTGEQPTARVFIDGKKAATLRGPTLAADFKAMVIDYIERRYGTGGAGRTAAE